MTSLPSSESPSVRYTFDSLAAGDVLPEVEFTVAADDVRAYLEATGESDDRWQEHVPPVMLSALMLASLLGQVVLPLGVMHTGQEHEMHRAVRIGEALTITVLVAQYSTRRGALMAAFDAEARAGGEVVAVSRASVLVPPPEETATAEESAE